MNVRYFIGDRPSAELVNKCITLNVNVDLMNQQTFEAIKTSYDVHKLLPEYDAIKAVHNDLKDHNFIKSHLCVFFQKQLSLLCKIILGRILGRRHTGRPRLLDRQQEDAIINYIRNCQCNGHCVTISQCTRYVNEYLLDGAMKISPKFIQNNNYIMGTLELGSPQIVEELRIAACYYDNFVPFFDRLSAIMSAYAYDMDLIINVDETTCNAEKSKQATKVLFDPSLNIRPMATYEGKVEHVTLCCAITASGKSLMPVFIIKNKNVTLEDCIVGPLSDCGDYGIASSPNGWQDTVNSLLFIHIRLIYLSRERFLNGSEKF